MTHYTIPVGTDLYAYTELLPRESLHKIQSPPGLLAEREVTFTEAEVYHTWDSGLTTFYWFWTNDTRYPLICARGTFVKITETV